MSKQEFLERLTDSEAFTAREVAVEFREYIETINLKHQVWTNTPHTDVFTVEVWDLDMDALVDIDAVFIDYAIQYKIGHLCYVTEPNTKVRRFQIKKGKRRGE